MHTCSTTRDATRTCVICVRRQVGWCEGVIEERNSEKRFKLGSDYVNFWVYYALDENLSKHVLELDGYAWGPEAEADSWVLLSKTDEEAEEEVEDVEEEEEAEAEEAEEAEEAAATEEE
jgi:hypothetical protein